MHVANTSTLPHTMSSHGGVGQSSTKQDTAGLSAAEQKVMPSPGAIYDSRWKVLPQSLQNQTLSRFDQDKCPLNHGISERAMCAGLSISWLKMMGKGDQDMSLRQSVERMSHLASFEGVVKSRVLQNYYSSEQQFRVKDQQARPEEYGNASKVALTHDCLIEAAKELEGIDLHGKLYDDGEPIVPLITYDDNDVLQPDPVMQQLVVNEVANSQQGIFAIYSDNGSHAVAFRKQPDSDSILLFDPNHGEFATTVKDFHTTITELSQAVGLTPYCAQVFAHSTGSPSGS